MVPPLRHLIVVLGDQLDRNSPAFDGFDPKQDQVWMAEVREESQHVPSHKARTALFLSAMRHFRDELIRRRWPVVYRTIEDPENLGSLEAELAESIRRHQPSRVLVVEPGDFRVLKSLRRAAGETLQVIPDTHFYSSIAEFAAHAKGRKQLRLEYFYRELRKRHGVLMEKGEPAGGAWNFDAENRESFPRQGPGLLPAPVPFAPDHLTKQVFQAVERVFPKNPGSLEDFDWPVTPGQARLALDDFIQNRLPHFGRYQDAMWSGEPWLYHSRISAALNLKLLDPRTTVQAAELAWREGRAPLAAVEGFVRQILGWREYVRGIYWHFMPEYAGGNALDAHVPLPEFFWTGDTEMNCLREAIGQTLRYGYAHHIQRLMVTGLYSLLLGVEPRQIHEWYLSVYVDAVEWVELPNVIGMSQFADGGVMASKPYAATGKYIQRMSNYCGTCRFDPAEATGERACPFTTLYWDFLLRNEERLRRIPRMELQLKNLARLSPARRTAIQQQAAVWKGTSVTK
jgi:deoxyribodipyrimidine photolyase-related protein